MSYVTGVLLCVLIFNNLACLWICVCFVIWTLLFPGLTNFGYSLRTSIFPTTRISYFKLTFKKALRMSGQEQTPGPSGLQKRKKVEEPGSFLMSPMKKRPRGADFSSKEKVIAINIYKYVKNSTPGYPYKTEIMKKTAEIMGTSQRTISKILAEYKKDGKLSSPDRSTPKYEVIKKLDDFTLSAIRRKVHQFYFANELPTIDKVLRAVNEDEDLPSFSRSTLYQIMKKLNFKYTKRSRRSILLDRPDLTVWRRNYLLKIKDYRRQNKKIYYTDETWLNEGHTASYVWSDMDIQSSRQAFLNGLSGGLKNPQKGKRLIITHIGSQDGFLAGGEWIFQAKKTDAEGDYHGEMDAHNFEKWFTKILNIVEPGSVIVLDNAPYHSRLAEQVPNLKWRKAQIQAWLQERGIHFDNSDIKVQLLTKFNKDNYRKKAIDEMAAKKNVIVLRLPPYHCELNPIELIWAQLKSHVGRNNKTFKMAEIKELLKEGLSKIGAESWKKVIDHIIKEEDKMMQLDGIIDDMTDTPDFIIHVSESDDDDDDCTTITDSD